MDPYTNYFLSSMFFYEYETVKNPQKSKKRRYSLEGFVIESKKILKIISKIPTDQYYISQLVSKLREKHMPTLGINPKVLEDFSKEYDLDEADLSKLYSECSYVIHNQPPLPFFSLLEVKFFKHFLEKYLQSIRLMAERLINEKIELKKTYIHLYEERVIKKCLETTDILKRKYDAEIKEIIKEALITLQRERPDFSFIDSLTLISIFHLISPSRKHLRGFSFVEEDVKDVVEKLKSVSFKIDIQREVDETLAQLQSIIIPRIEKYKEFSSLTFEEKRKVIFYLLFDYLPEITTKLIEN
jgi:hypothetical protein